MEQGLESGNSNTKQMTLEDARKVMWLRNRPEFFKPMGTLLDEGYLTRDRLKWASEKGYTSQLRQAATVILDSLTQSEEAPRSALFQIAMTSSVQSIDVNMSIDEAENAPWPFSSPPNCKGNPMGPMVNSRQLGFKDLAYAVEKAWDKRVKQAATVLMLGQLKQTLNEPSPSEGPLRIFSCGRSFAEKKQLELALLLGMLSGAFIVTPVFLLYAFVFPKIDLITKKLLQTEFIKDVILFPFGYFELPQTITTVQIAAYTVIITIVLVSVVLVMWLFMRVINYIADRVWESINKYRKGQEGENKVAEAVIANLDGAWSLFRNISLPGRNKSDLDLVLIGPPGVWVLEVKNFDGQYKNNGEDWKYHSGNNLKPLKKSPSIQAKNSASRLADFLKADGITQWVNTVVVWANEECQLTVDNPAVPVWLYNRLPEELGNIWQNKPMEKSQQERIESKLIKLCE